MKLKRYVIVGTGQQAPYGVGEYIADTNSRKAAERIAARWYNRPKILLREEYLSQKAKARS